MEKTFRERFADFLLSDPAVTELPTPATPINENSLLKDTIEYYPDTLDFIERRYGLKPDVTDQQLDLKEFSQKHGLPSAEQLLSGIQTGRLGQQVRFLTAQEAKSFCQKYPKIRLLDVREDNKNHPPLLSSAQSLNPKVLDEILLKWPRHTPILLYCEQGNQSIDAAQFLADRGFTQVYVLKDGVADWNRTVSN